MKEISEKSEKRELSKTHRFLRLVRLFVRSQISAFIGVIFDYSIMITLTEFVGLYYIYSIVAGASVGAVVNYLINRFWAFNSRKESPKTQLAKFIFVWATSLFLKILGTYLLTECTHLDYKISRLIADGTVAYGYIFVLQKNWVFKE